MEFCRLPGGPSGGFVCSRPAARRCHKAAACRIVPRASPTWSSGRHPPEDLPPACAPVSSLSLPDQFSSQLAFASSWDKSGVGSGRVPESMTIVHLCYLIVQQHKVISVHPRCLTEEIIHMCCHIVSAGPFDAHRQEIPGRRRRRLGNAARQETGRSARAPLSARTAQRARRSARAPLSARTAH